MPPVERLIGFIRKSTIFSLTKPIKFTPNKNFHIGIQFALCFNPLNIFFKS